MEIQTSHTGQLRTSQTARPVRDSPTEPLPLPDTLPKTSSPELLGLLEEVDRALDAFNWINSSQSELSRIAQHLGGDHTIGTDALPDLERQLARLAELLKVPSACTADEDELDADQTLEKERFLHQSPALHTVALALARILPPQNPNRKPPVELLEERSRLILTFGRFTNVDLCEGFSTSAASSSAQETCQIILARSHRYALLSHILAKSFPPLFKPHPKLNPSTGRVLSRPRGGDRAIIDWYEEGDDIVWRYEAGMANVVHIVVEAVQPEKMEDLWPLLLPPVLAFLDDYEPRNKLAGTWILASLLPRVSASLLTRTGVGEVFTQSLSSLSSLSNPYTPRLLTASTLTSLSLLSLLHPPSPPFPSPALSLARFTALSALLTSSTITPFSHHPSSLPLALAISSFLPSLLQALGPSSTRFFQFLIPHLSGLLGEIEVGEGTWEVLESVGRALEATVTVAKEVGRVERWKGVVGGVVGRCWVRLGEGEGEEGRREGVREVLRGVVGAMGEEEAGEVWRKLGVEGEGKGKGVEVV